MKRLFFTAVALLATMSVCNAQVPIEPTEELLTMISTKYFGPYAFPVPDNNQGKLCSDIRGELSFDYVRGTIGGGIDHTWAPCFLISAPLWTDRATLSIWGEFHEWYRDSRETREARRVSDEYPLSGHDCGNIYVGLEFLALREKRYVPSVVLRALLLTATGDEYEKARHYDAPGYCFDVTLGKDFKLSSNGEHLLRASAGLGFLCWQVDRGTQNDALLVEAGLSYRNKWLNLETSYGQYTGRIGFLAAGEGDRPKSIKARVGFNIGMFTPFLYFQQGLQDWPFTQFRVGLRVDVNVLGRKFSKSSASDCP